MQLTKTRKVIIAGVAVTVITTSSAFPSFASASENIDNQNGQFIMHVLDDGFERVRPHMDSLIPFNGFIPESRDKQDRLPRPFIIKNGDEIGLDNILDRMPELTKEEVMKMLEDAHDLNSDTDGRIVHHIELMREEYPDATDDELMILMQEDHEELFGLSKVEREKLMGEFMHKLRLEHPDMIGREVVDRTRSYIRNRRLEINEHMISESERDAIILNHIEMLRSENPNIEQREIIDGVVNEILTERDKNLNIGLSIGNREDKIDDIKHLNKKGLGSLMKLKNRIRELL